MDKILQPHIVELKLTISLGGFQYTTTAIIHPPIKWSDLDNFSTFREMENDTLRPCHRSEANLFLVKILLLTDW